MQFVSPQVWASRAGRAHTLAENHDLLLSIFPFEKAWYARSACRSCGGVCRASDDWAGVQSPKVKDENSGAAPCVVLLPGSRADEVRRHLPVVTGAFELLRRESPDAKG